jgi:hypothetical protein
MEDQELDRFSKLEIWKIIHSFILDSDLKFLLVFLSEWLPAPDFLAVIAHNLQMQDKYI